MTPPDRNELLLIRHAPADHGGRLCGRRDVAAILPEAEALAPLRDWLAECREVVTSPALRCRQTAGALFPDRELPEDPALWEQDFGAHDGLRFDEIPDLGRLSRTDLADHRPPGGESFADMAARLRPAFAMLSERARQGGPLAVVAHAGTVRAALGLVLGELPVGLGFEVAPLSVTRLRCFEGGVSVVATNWAGPGA
ncbi:histidine phosphatase family protein [Salipiger abyssi]|uniref:Alpha-ribazole phosphatase n=1 Tax=Salipiger abyssi TaxID=1250539 RepID=A0A1P8USN1_9RHOB|nr:histidine phosphatase family protein [Salipiger abyssi]APZ52410.1 alpha-ribazole phosphatase [Salipiger abyssi]